MSKMDNTVSRYSLQKRFHIYAAKGKKRTTISLHRTLAELVAIALGHQPESREANRAITQWLQQQFDQHMDTRHMGTQSISYYMQSYAFELIADNILSSKHQDWLLEYWA
jgi:hypothetical protein